jgi:hypothetical protein
MIPVHSMISRFSAPLVCACLLAACGGGVDDGYGGGAPMSPPPPAPSAPALVVRTAALSGAQEVPAVATTASGRGAVAVDPTTRAVTGAITFAGLTGPATGAHIHKGAPGNEGGVEIGLTLHGSDAAIVPPGTILTEAQYDALLARARLVLARHGTGPGSARAVREVPLQPPRSHLAPSRRTRAPPAANRVSMAGL